MSSILFAQQCDTFYKEFDIYATVNEAYEWDVRKYFFTGENLVYSFDGDSPYFDIVQPINQIGDPKPYKHKPGSQIQSLKPLIQQETGFWLNNFVLLEQTITDATLFFAFGDPQQIGAAPEFQTQLNLRNQTNKLTCFDLDYISLTRIVVDCYQSDLRDEDNGYLNWFIMVDLTDTENYQMEANHHAPGYNYNQTAARKIFFHNFTFTIGADGKEIKEGEPLTDGWRQDVKQLLFRGEPAWATEHADGYLHVDSNCVIEVYEFSNNKLTQSKPFAVLTGTELGKLSGFLTNQFYFIDFKIELNGDILILDFYYYLYVLRLSSSGEWTLKSRTNKVLQQCIGFYSQYQLQDDQTQITNTIYVFPTIAQFYQNERQKYEIKLPKTANFENLQVLLSQSFIVMKLSSFVYLYDINNGSLIYTYNAIDLIYLILNPQSPDLIAITTDSSHRLSISNGYLRLKTQSSTHTNVTQSYSLIATKIDQLSNRCKVILKVQILNETDTNIYPLSYRVLPFYLTVPNYPIVTDHIASGPNLQYSFPKTKFDDSFKESQLQLTIEQVHYLNLNNTQIDLTDIVFSDLLTLDNESQFYLLLQKSSKIVFIYLCQHKVLLNEQADCRQYTQFTLFQIIDKSQYPYIWWIKNEEITFIHQDTNSSIQIYSCAEFLCRNSGTITEPSSISHIAFTFDTIFLVLQQSREVKLYETCYPFDQIYIINEAELAQFNPIEQFNPVKVFANKKGQSQLVIIQSQTFLFLGVMKKKENNRRQFILLNYLHISMKSTIQAVIGQKHFFIAQLVNNNYFIEEYNYQNLYRVYKTKNLPFFNYQLQNPLTIDSPSQTGWLFAQAKDGNQTIILVYEPGAVSHNCLRLVLGPKALNNDGGKLYMSVDGSSQMFFYFKYNNIHQVLSIFQKPQLYANPNVEGQKYVNEILSQLLISNFPGNAQLSVLTRIQVIITQTNAIINQMVIDNSENIFQFAKQAAVQTINMGTNWYTGQVTGFEVACKTCLPGDLSIISNIYPITDGLDMNFQIYDGVQFGSYGQVYQGYQSFIFQNPNGQFKKVIPYGFWGGDFFETLTVSEDTKFIVSIWSDFLYIQNIRRVGVMIFLCNNGDDCTRFRQGVVVLEKATKIGKVQFADQINLIFLQTNRDNFGAIDNFILVNKFIYDQKYVGSFDIPTVYTINNSYVGVELLQIGDFDVIKYKLNGTTYNTILFTDINNGLYFTHFGLDSAGIFSKTTYELFDLKSYINEQYYVDSDTKFYQVRVISKQVVGTNLQLTVLITTSNTAQYIFYFELNGSKPMDGLPIIKESSSLQYILAPYGTWKSLDKLAYVDGYVAIPYFYEERVVIGVYRLPSEKTNVVKIIPFSHGIGADYEKQVSVGLTLLLTKELDNKYPFLYVNLHKNINTSNYLIQKYELRDDPVIKFSNSDNYGDKVSVSVTTMNDFTWAEGQINLTVAGSDPQPDQKSGRFNWWFIWLLAILLIIVFIFGGWYIYHKYYKTKSGLNPLLI